MTVELTVTIPGIEDKNTAAHYLNRALRTLRTEQEEDDCIDASFPGLQHKHEDWDWNQACPECGSENLCIGEVTYTEQHATGETLEYGKQLEFSGGIVSVSCNNTDCLIDLYVSPAGYLAEK